MFMLHLIKNTNISISSLYIFFFLFEWHISSLYIGIGLFFYIIDTKLLFSKSWDSDDGYIILLCYTTFLVKFECGNQCIVIGRVYFNVNTLTFFYNPWIHWLSHIHEYLHNHLRGLTKIISNILKTLF
jgi:hypothetical protein